MLKKFIIPLVLLIFAVLIPLRPVAAEEADVICKAKVVKILQSKESSDEKGKKVIQQDLELLLLDGPKAGKKVDYKGVSEITVANAKAYRAGDRVVVSMAKDQNGDYQYYVLDFLRTNSLIWLTVLFVAICVAVGGWRGLTSLLSLFVSALLIMKVLVPAILAGYDPLLVGCVISFFVLLLIIYVTDGWNKSSHLAVAGIFISLVVTVILGYIFSDWTNLSGLSEESVFVQDAINKVIDFKGMLLASFIIGTLGVLDDVVIGQIESVKQIKNANPNLSTAKVFKMGITVGRSHLGAIINTLFLAYAGASFSLLLLFGVNNPPFVSFEQIINHEDIATEIVRTLVGVVGLALAMPIATWLAAVKLKPEDCTEEKGHH